MLINQNVSNRWLKIVFPPSHNCGKIPYNVGKSLINFNYRSLKEILNVAVRLIVLWMVKILKFRVIRAY